ncbi:uncharacterized protein OCT59_001653 [Rhizophagus irregularis]|uniref:BTB domain-containing protein n=1 Tax=Rhizophagus irregularis (strain DAOM 181602 / DAOM 197198 / MUCL 43194) TaxID=747089 RepID=A0A2P4QAJ0_RHIID|nr:hypothetical protein GLOIN_2v1873435 [Rhizophagus irregularis DAOM 181602=DAOM 197198]POG74664.1 hypothetical protein GLOIN_2v1873435 [Rhizophagus irregularis DAOM 181602=DAOM 197198]UZO10055.1 hypothetical protein OCT59_001653 [Rhizophagus irregularis]GBC41347.2 BTB/POZ protein [Rhizophagus irregularis DAOM 181602=DAOM 197198]|eukprot:XP_025181530.1 hypothetical protein GLOIN_2v1873435 [Rhizophagus irregularis DAOM 181602=DAOM 197198]
MSPFFISNKKNNNDLAHIKLLNISPETFQIILRYLYGGIFSLNGQDTLDIFKVLIAADELLLDELVDYFTKGCLQMKEIKVWEHVLKWGLVQNQTLISDPDTWIDEIFKMMGNNLQNCIPLIRFFSLSSKEFLHEVSLHNKIFEPSAL